MLEDPPIVITDAVKSSVRRWRLVRIILNTMPTEQRAHIIQRTTPAGNTVYVLSPKTVDHTGLIRRVMQGSHRVVKELSLIHI